MQPPDAPLWEWRPFTEHGEELRQMAIEGVRRLADRQSDAEMLLDKGLDFPMLYMSQMDLEATPALCESARKFLHRLLRSISPATPGQPYSSEKGSVDSSLATIEWLLQHGCDCGPGVAQIEAAVRAYPRAADRGQTLATLARILKATPKPQPHRGRVFRHVGLFAEYCVPYPGPPAAGSPTPTGEWQSGDLSSS